MKSFKEYTGKEKYIAVEYDEKSQKKLREWALKNGFNLSVDYDDKPQDPKDFDFHTTVFYTVNKVLLRNSKRKIEPQEVTITGIDFLGVDKNIPVLKVEYSGAIKELRQKYEKMGLKDAWDTYKPHISLSYAKEKIDTKNIKLPDFKPTFDHIIVKDQKK